MTRVVLDENTVLAAIEFLDDYVQSGGFAYSYLSCLYRVLAELETASSAVRAAKADPEN